MWEQDVGISRPSTSRSTAQDTGARSKTPRTPRTPNEESINSQIIGAKSSTGIQPKKLQTKKQHDARLKASLRKK